MRVLLAGIFIVIITITSCAYKPSSFQSDYQQFPGQRATAGCLDVAVQRRADSPRGTVIMNYAFGNRCDRPVVVDLAAVRVIGRAADGTAYMLPAYDPRREIEPRWLDGRAVGREALAYVQGEGLVDVCVDAASVARVTMTQWLCFASQPRRLEVP